MASSVHETPVPTESAEFDHLTVECEDGMMDDDGVTEVSLTWPHQAERSDPQAGLHHFRRRDYDPTPGRWVQQNPVGYVEGDNLYLYESEAPGRAANR